MKNLKVVVLFALAALPLGGAEQVNPLAKVFDLIDQLKGKISADGETENAAYKKFADYCGTTAKNVQYEIETAGTLESKLSSKVTKLASDIVVGDSKIKDLGGSASKAESELKEATAIRKKEAGEFEEGEKALMATVDSLERALSVLEKEVNSGKSFAQIDTSSLTTLMQTLSFVDEAAALDGSSMNALTSLIQAHDEDADEDTGAPAGAAYSKKSGSIMEILEDMKDKADNQLADLRSGEMKAKHAYEMLKQSLEDEVKAMDTELGEEKSAKAEAGEEKASSEGNLDVATKEKGAAEEKNGQVSGSCQTAATDHEANVGARREELKVIGEAEKILKESTGGAEDRQYSFLQTQLTSTAMQRMKAKEVATSSLIKTVQRLAKQQHSAALAQLASRIAATMKYAGARHSADPFEKVKGLINSMISKLEREASEDATEKAYCDGEMSKTKTKKDDLEDAVTKLESKIGKSAAKSSALKEEVGELNMELSVLAKEQANMDTIRREESAAHAAAKADLEQGLGGVRKALSVLRDFYGSSGTESLLQEDEDGDRDEMSSLMQQAVKQPSPPQKAEKKTGAGTGIMQLLEVVESDLAKNLATEDTEESDAQTTYEKQTQANKVAKAQKETDGKLKTGEFKALDKSVSELQADKATEVDELTAVSEYFGKIQERCVAKPTPYEELKARRDAEIQGLKEAMASLESEAFMQVGNPRRARALRGDALRPDSE